MGSPRRYQVTVDAVADVVAGGEGLVYRAHDTGRDAEVALKLLTVVNIADYGRLVERSTPFTLIDHPNLMSHVEVFIGTALTNDPTPDIDDFDVIYTVADWVDGQPLPDVAEAIDTRSLLGYVSGVAHALHALHRHRSGDAPSGIVHRDVKPSNVRITPDGRPVLIDFGVARPLDQGDLTQGVGTYRWRAPEVLSGSASITTAVDAWGLGAIAYWTLAGQPPGLDGAATAREQLTHTPRCRQVGDPVGVATHIAALLETNPDKRPADLARWATQLDTILARNRRSAWKRPTAVTAVALMAIPGAALFVDVSGDDRGATTSTTLPAATAPAADQSSDTTQPAARELVPAVGEIWNVACLGNPDSTIVSGAEPGQLVTLAVEYAPGVPALSEEFSRPLSRATGIDGSTGPALPPGARRLGPSEVRADETGSFVVEWHCFRGEVGRPIVLTLTALGGPRTQVRVEARDELTGLEIAVATNTKGGNQSINLVAGTTYVLDVSPQLTATGRALVSAAGFEYTGRNFDPRMVVTSADPSIARVTDAAGGLWEISAVAVGTAVIEARILGTDHAATTTVEVISAPDPPVLTDGRYEPGAVTDYLASVLNTQPAMSSFVTEPGPNSNGIPYPLLLPQCDDIGAFSNSDWLEAEQLFTPVTAAAESGGATIVIHTFPDSASADKWTATFRAAANQRVGRECELIDESDPTTFEPLTDISPSEFTVNFPPSELSVTTAHNVVAVVLATPGDHATVRGALATALSRATT